MTHRRTKAGAATARFREIDRYDAHAHHDALEFPDGLIVPLTRLVPGQRASVLQLPAVGVEQKAVTTQPAGVAASTSPVRETIR